MRVLIKRKCMSTSAGMKRNGDEADLPEDEVSRILKLHPSALEILPEEKPAPQKRGRKKKRAHNDDGTFKADDPKTPKNEAYE